MRARSRLLGTDSYGMDVRVTEEMGMTSELRARGAAPPLCGNWGAENSGSNGVDCRLAVITTVQEQTTGILTDIKLGSFYFKIIVLKNTQNKQNLEKWELF